MTDPNYQLKNSEAQIYLNLPLYYTKIKKKV